VKILTKQYIYFFFIVLVISPLIGMGLMHEKFSPLFAARALFTATISTVLYFILNKKFGNQSKEK